MRISSHVAVGSPMVRVAAIAVATLLLALTIAGAGVVGSRLLAADGAIVVDLNGEGTTTTIGEAIAMADDGDTILVRPGTYGEAIVIDDKDITVSGDGPREEIVVSFDDGVTPVVTLSQSDATLSNLTLTGENSQVAVVGGAPTLQGLVFDGVGMPFQGPGDSNRLAYSLTLTGGTRAAVIDNTLVDGGELGVHGDSTPLIEGNTLANGPQIYLQSAGDETVIRGNTISGPQFNGMGLASAGSYLIEGNAIVDAPAYGIMMSPAAGMGLAPIIRDNAISRSETAISMTSGPSSATITGNELTGNGTGIATTSFEGLIEGNRISDGEAGIVLSSRGSPTVRGNEVEVTGQGIDVGPLTEGVVSGNTVCGGEVSIHVAEDATASVIDNELWQEAAPTRPIEQSTGPATARE